MSLVLEVAMLLKNDTVCDVNSMIIVSSIKKYVDPFPIWFKNSVTTKMLSPMVKG